MTFFSSQCASGVAVLLAGTILTSSCASSTMLQSLPTGAKVYLNGEAVGTTPYRHTDSKIVGSTTSVRLEKEGYETYNTAFSRDEEADVGAIVGGVFLLIPFLWTMKYKPEHSYELKSIIPGAPAIFTAPAAPVAPAAGTTTKSRAERLRENKKLFDEKVLTEAEYEKEKKRILAEPE
ncbi:PEGA domain-containing protein [Hymenobacter arizonensis]|uniref:PEGA domain-containing protein n=1 Tax=Hymenobacter arizonensis TaxID=1227077 RepID=A0A1I5YU38_HYMAR|nr:PEGA domain-containing protein [Hymenobacter arizonensis]SFQ47754.1 PEGA domain-containing protein [Hymenobacter arizonensis]